MKGRNSGENLAKSLSNKKYLIKKRDVKTGFMQTIVYTGNIKNKPKGWKISKRIE